MANNLKAISKSLEKITPRKFTKKSLQKIVGPTKFDLDVEAINKTINKPTWDFLDRGGKRWRPTLFLTIVELLGKNPKDFVDLAAVFEIIHNATLIHDDIEDSSEARRGKPTLHLIYGLDLATNVGDALYFLPMKVLDKYNDKLSETQKLLILETYVLEMIKLSFGQATDIAWHNSLVDTSKITESQYLQMCAFKTGGLARMACKVAAIVGGADERLVKALGQLGESLGVVFQIQDDILNITESELSKNKGLGEDITEGKISLPVIFALKNLLKPRVKRLIKILSLHTRDKKLITEAIGIIKGGQGIEKAGVRMKALFTKSWEKLNPLLVNGEGKDKLYSLARFLIERQV